MVVSPSADLGLALELESDGSWVTELASLILELLIALVDLLPVFL